MTLNTLRDITDYDLAITGVFSLRSVCDWTVQDWLDNGIDPDAAGYEWDGYQQTSILIGFKEGTDGKYEEDLTADYSAIVSLDFAGGVVQVVRSKFFTRSAMCSPCFPGQADADTPGDYICFALDPEDIYDESGEGLALKSRIFVRPF